MSAPTITTPGTAGGGIPVGGSGATGYVAKWTAATTLGGSATSGANASPFIGATGNVGIGTASPVSALDVSGTITCDDAATGIKLPAASGNADVQTLDCYVEASFTPVVTYGTGGTVTTVTAEGKYTKIGNVVTYTGTIIYTVTAAPTGGGVTVSLPVTSAPAANQSAGSYMFNNWAGFAGNNAFQINGSSPTGLMRVSTATGQAEIATFLTTSSAFVFSMTYLAS